MALAAPLNVKRIQERHGRHIENKQLLLEQGSNSLKASEV